LGVIASIRDPASDVLQHDIPVVALTANAMDNDREQYLRAGINDHVVKPLVPQALADAIERCVRLPASATADQQGTARSV